MTLRRAFQIGLLVLLVAVAVSLYLRNPHREDAPGVRIGAAAPELEGSTLDGKPFKLSDLHGRVVLVNFWATWCDPCREEIPQLIKIYGQYRGEGLTILGVSVDEDGPRPVSAFADQFHIDYPIVMPTEEAVDRWNLFGIPATFLVDRAGTVVRRFFGFPGVGRLSKEIEEALKAGSH